MLQRDYFMKMTQMLVSVLEKVLLNKERKNFDDAQTEIESAAKTIVGIDLKLISILNIEDVMQLMKTSDVYAGRCLISAELLKEYGDILIGKGKAKESVDVYNKSLYLYVEAVLTKEIPDAKNYYDRINFLTGTLSKLKFTPAFKQQVFEYFEMSGQYSKAEDILFEMIDEEVEGIDKKGIKFYERLLDHTDEELSKGNLSREEVEESLAEIITIEKNI
ncbi:MAG: DUF6483 family protein [Ignavibacteria bacterium]